MITRAECEEAVNEVCKMCFKKHELEYGEQPVNCAFRAFDNEDCPMVTVLKKLIQEHFDEKEDDDVSIRMHANRREPTEQEKQVKEQSEEKFAPMKCVQIRIVMNVPFMMIVTNSSKPLF